MLKIIEKVLIFLLKDKLLQLIYILLFVLITWFSSLAPGHILMQLVHKLTIPILGKIIYILTSLVFALSLILLRILFKSKNKLKLRFGIYWDNKLNRYCANCQTPLSKYYSNERTGNGFECPNRDCKARNLLIDIKGDNIKLEQALSQLMK